MAGVISLLSLPGTTIIVWQVMRITMAMLACGGAAFLGLAGCATDPNRIGVTNQRQPGPAAGRAVGTGVGAVSGNVAGAVVGFGEGVGQGAAQSFDNTTRIVRRWRTETTADGRTIQVPEDIVVDEQGRPVKAPPAPPQTNAAPATKN
jgi:hypothetical protein